MKETLCTVVRTWTRQLTTSDESEKNLTTLKWIRKIWILGSQSGSAGFLITNHKIYHLMKFSWQPKVILTMWSTYPDYLLYLNFELSNLKDAKMFQTQSLLLAHNLVKEPRRCKNVPDPVLSFGL